MGKAEEIAERQHALITHAQAIACGLTNRQVLWRVNIGRWDSPVRGLYRISGAPVTPVQCALAPCLVGPAGTLVSHVSSLALRELWRWPILPHVTVAVGRSPRLPIAKVHRTVTDPIDRTWCLGLPCTSVARAIVESAALVDEASLKGVIDTAVDRRLTSIRAIIDAAGRASKAPGRKGIPRLRLAMAEWTDGIRPGSPAEMRLLRQLKAWGYPSPEKQVPVYDAAGALVAVVDLAWPVRWIGIEYDSTLWHNPRKWAHDEARHALVESLGYKLLHADKLDLMPGERGLRDELARAWRAAA